MIFACVVAALKDSATEDNVYSEAYLGKLLALAGKLYFAQIDIADTMAAEVYGVNSVRALSEGITGYEVKTSSLYGNVTNLNEGNLFIDIDIDVHNVVSLTGDEDAPREYMIATGMLSSAYEGIVWEQLTGYEGVSTISVLANAKEENIRKRNRLKNYTFPNRFRLFTSIYSIKLFCRSGVFVAR